MRWHHDYFWGLLLIIGGGAYLIKEYFHLEISVWRFVVGFIFIYLGLSIVFGGRGIRDGGDMLFNNGTVVETKLEKEYNIVFSNQKLDLSNIVPGENIRRIKINTVFSNGVVVINPNINVRIKANAAFAQATLPDRSSIFFGNTSYSSSNGDSENYLEIEANCVFGQLTIVRE